ncbi:MAG: IS4 family transposase, partial [Nitrospirae bacterium]|nr:IS4 family transposase [Nitrospirota bacterium]
MSRKVKEPIKAEAVQGVKYFQVIEPILEKLRGSNEHFNRELHYDKYILMYLLYYFNPIIDSLRGLTEVSKFEKIQKALGIKRYSLSSLSEAGYVFDSKLLEPVVGELAGQALKLETDNRLKSIEQAIVAVDGTIIHALPKILWALWLDKDHKAAKVHLEFDVIKHVPVWAEVTDGNANEKSILRGKLTRNKLYVMDAGYGQYRLFEEIRKVGSNFVCRLRDNAAWELIEENRLTEADRLFGVQRDMTVHLGGGSTRGDLSAPVRVIEVHHKGSSNRRLKVSSKTKIIRTDRQDYTMLLVTDRMDLSAETIALIYKYRWQIELFFRWFKCIMGFNHLLNQSRNGLSIQVYCALIASMLITLWTGTKPTKR